MPFVTVKHVVLNSYEMRNERSAGCKAGRFFKTDEISYNRRSV
jgi:hypothetical protein